MHVSGSHITQYKHFDVSEYLNRIECPLDVNQSVRYLRALHRAHLTHVPFENLDNFLGNEIILDIDHLYKKVVQSRRGGFCYELNGLFYQLLNILGYKTRLISARVYKQDGQLGPEFDHMAMVVTIGIEHYLVDVGFGTLFLQPLLLKLNRVQIDQNKYFKVIRDFNKNFILQSSKDSIGFKNEYLFTLKERKLIEFIDMCTFHSNSRKSHMTRHKYICQFTKNGKINLWDKVMHIWDRGMLEKVPVANSDDFFSKVYQHFNIYV